jgi:methyl-accepting chemotaxis protein
VGLKEIRLTSLRTKMIVVLVPLTVVVLGAMTLIAVSRMTSAQRDSANVQMTHQAAREANRFDGPLERSVALSRSVAEMMGGYRGLSRADATSMLRQVAAANPDLVGVYVGYAPNGFDGKDAQLAHDRTQAEKGLFAPNWNRLNAGRKLELTPIHNLLTDGVFTGPKRTLGDVVTEPVAYGGVLMSSFVSPILRDGRRFVGIAGNDRALTSLDASARRIKALTSGYAFLVSNGGVFVSAPKKALIGKQTLTQLAGQKGNTKLLEIAAAIKRGRGGHVQTTDPFTGKKVDMFWAPVRAGNFGLVLSVPTGEVMAEANKLRTLLLIAGLVGTLLMAGVVVLFATRLTKPLSAFVERLTALNDVAVAGLKEGMRALARGDLTVAAHSDVQHVDVAGHDEIARATATLNQLIDQTAESVDAYNESRDHLGELIGRVSQSALSVSASSQQVATTSEEAGRAVTEIANAVGDVAEGAERQVRAVESVRAATAQLAATTSESAANAQQTSEAAQQARGLADDGASAVAQATEAMNAVREASEQATEAIGALGTKSEQIVGIVQTITKIAEQTNLLALNAAIEAARAGEHGRGFAVVAEEVRKLAEESQHAAASIGALIGEIRAETERTVEVVESGARRSVESAQTVEQARETFTHISASVEQMADRVAQIATAVEQISATSKQMNEEVGEVAAVAEQTSASSQQVSASTQETSASTQQIAATAQELSRTAEELEELVGRFTLQPA